MKKVISLLFSLALVTSLWAQMETVNFDYKTGTFNNLQPLPAEVPLLIRGDLPRDIDRVEVSLFNNNNLNQDPLAEAVWKRPEGSDATAFEAALNYRLRPSNDYSFKIQYFRRIEDRDREELYRRIENNIESYLDQAIKVKNDELELVRSEQKVIDDLNAIVKSTLSKYRGQISDRFTGFSDVSKRRLEQIGDIDLDRNVQKDTSTTREEYARRVAEEIKSHFLSELRADRQDPWLTLADERIVKNYETEKKPGYFALHAGYGGIYLGGNIDNLDYDNAPYVGFAFPLSTRESAPGFLRNASLTFSVFLQEMRDSDDNKITGPVIQRPIAVGIDYKLFQFIYLNAGAAVLERQFEADGGDSPKKEVFLQPYVGVHAKVNISLGLGN